MLFPRNDVAQRTNFVKGNIQRKFSTFQAALAQYTAAYNRGELRAVPIPGSRYDSSHGVTPSQNPVTRGPSRPNQQGSSSGSSSTSSSTGSSDDEYWSQIADDVTELMDQVKI